MRGVELREIADATKISLRFLQAIEDDRMEVLPGGLFPQAFVRQYARYLGLDADKVVNDFVYAQRGEAVVVPRPENARPRSTGPGLAVPAGVALAALVVVVGGVVAWKARAVRPVPAPAEVTASPSAVVRSEDRVYPPPSVATPAPDAAQQGLVLRLEARQTCWVKVQADRITVLNRTLAAGDEQAIEASEEIVLNVGNAGGLAFTINGRKGVPLGEPGEVRTNIVINQETLPSLVESAPRASRPAPRSPATEP